MIHAGRLHKIEEAIAGLSNAPGSGNAPAPPKPRPTPAPAASSGDLRTRLHATFVEAKHMHIADAVENSTIAESGSELIVTAPKMYGMYFKESAFAAAVNKIAGKAMKITINAGEAAPPPVAAAPPREDEVTARALSNPEVQRFQEMFPDSQVRTVRNLREN